MDLKIKVLTTPMPWLFGLFALMQFSVLVLCSINGHAQIAMPISGSSSPMCISSRVGTTADITEFNHLTTELQSAIFLVNGEQKLYGNVPTCLFTDAMSLANYREELTSVSEIRLVQIKISTADALQNPIDLSHFVRFSNLKYIHILSEIETSKAAVKQLLHTIPPDVIVFLTINKPS